MDALTGLPTRAGFEELFGKALAHAQKTNTSVSVGVVDIDLLGQINKEYGRDAGDAVIMTLGRRMQQVFCDKGAVCRFGGDALAVMWPDLEKEQAFLLLEQFRQGLNGRLLVYLNGTETALPMTVSAGLAAYPDDGARLRHYQQGSRRVVSGEGLRSQQGLPGTRGKHGDQNQPLYPGSTVGITPPGRT